MQIRRVVTAKTSSGKSTVAHDGPSPAARALKHTPGFVSTPLWFTAAPTRGARDRADNVEALKTLLPGPGETSFMVVTFPPDSVFQSAGFDFAASGQEFAEAVPGIAQAMEPENPGMHTTATVDYGVVIDGEVWLELDDGETVHLKTGDTFVQNGVRHAWRNKGDRPASIAVVLVGASA